MAIPGLRILTKQWKRYLLLGLVVACLVMTVKVGQQWVGRGAGELVLDQRMLPAASLDGIQSPPPLVSAQDQSRAKAVNIPPPAGIEPDSLSAREMEMRNAKLEAELKYEKLKAELLNRDLLAAQKSLNNTIPVKKSTPKKAVDAVVVPMSYNETAKSLGVNKTPKPGAAGDAAGDASENLQERRRVAFRRVCKESPKETGLVRTVMKTRQGVTYCHVPGVMETFWLRVLRFVNQDYVIDPASPLDISKKDAHERPFIRLRQLRWSRLSEDEKTPILRSKIFMAVQNPYMRLWELYIHSMVLPVLWSTVGVQIEAKRKSNELLVKQGMKRKKCGKDITFEEFVSYTLEASGPAYEPYNRLCDPCQLNPTYIVKAETSKEDAEKVLKLFNLDYLVTRPSYANSTIVKYLSDLVTDVMPRFTRSKAEHCVTPGDIGKSLWRALKMEGLIAETALPPLLDDSKTPQVVLDLVTGLYIRANLNVDRQKARMMVEGYRMLSSKTKEAVRQKYRMDFRMFEYSDKVEDVTSGLI